MFSICTKDAANKGTIYPLLIQRVETQLSRFRLRESNFCEIVP